MAMLRMFIKYHFTLLISFLNSSTGCEMKEYEEMLCSQLQTSCIDLPSSKRMDDKVNYIDWMEL